VGAFVAGLRLGLLAVLAVLGVHVLWRLAPARAAQLPLPSIPSSVRPPASYAPDLPSVPPAAAPDREARADIDRLRGRRLLMPVEGYDLRRLHDGFREPRGARSHEAIDLMAARGTRVRAVDDGVIRRLASSARGGISIYQVDPDGRYCYYYAHLDRYAAFLAEGRIVRKGEVLGYVGSTGNAAFTAPHLHFAVYRLDDPERWWDGPAVNPFPVWAGDSASPTP
jgi:murein DD-endopeptidase MepM/ murein hydrolase activator NlpD